MKERIKELDEQLRLHPLMVPDAGYIGGQKLDEQTLRLMELRARLELAEQIDYLNKAIRDIQALLRNRL